MYCWIAGAVTVKFGSPASDSSRTVLSPHVDLARASFAFCRVERRTC